MRSLLICIIAIPTLAQDVPQPPARGSSKWGKDDQRGAIQYITPGKTAEAARLIKQGKIYSLGHVYEEAMPSLSGRSYSLVIPQPDLPQGRNRILGHDEFVATQIGQVGTQFDGLGHVGIGEVFYNGWERKDFVRYKGLQKLGIENVGVFFTRGILLDIAALKGVARLEKGYEITPDDLKKALVRQKLEIRSGDAVLIHTGWGSLWIVDNAQFTSGEPGIGVASARFLVQSQIALVGSDNWGVDVAPNPIPDLVFPAHQELITIGGTYVLEALDTSELARDGVHEFAFIFSPLRMKGATGSPGNPIAVR